MNADDIKIAANSSRFSKTVELLIYTGNSVAKEVVMEDYKHGDYCEPTLVISQNAAQQLMDELWQAGLRPTEGSGSAGALAATQKHLDDMRALVFREAGQQ